MCVSGVVFFFFQAEDGIRDLVRSRGLGDVYKRQVRLGYRYVETDVQVTADGVLLAFHDNDLRRTCGPVSYTHLTLPTSDLV